MRLNEISNINKNRIDHRYDFKNRIDENLNELFDIKGDYDIDDDGFIHVDGTCTPGSGVKIEKLPIKFGVVSVRFACIDMGLTTLEGCPIQVKGNFNCGHNHLTSFKGAPTQIGQRFLCSSNYGPPLPNLIGIPDSLLNLSVRSNLLSLDGLPHTIRDTISILYNKKLPLLKLLFVNSLQRIEIIETSDMSSDSLDDLNELMNKYIGKGRSGALSCCSRNDQGRI